MNPRQLTKRELEAYERGFLDGRADLLQEFLMAMEMDEPEIEQVQRVEGRVQ